MIHAQPGPSTAHLELMLGWCLPPVDTLQSHHPSAPAGFSARQRKQELERLNEQLRKINMGLRQQARAGTVYAPGLTYAPPPSDQAQVGTSSTCLVLME